MIAATYVVQLLGVLGIIVGLAMLVAASPKREKRRPVIFSGGIPGRRFSAGDASTPYRTVIIPRRPQ